MIELLAVILILLIIIILYLPKKSTFDTPFYNIERTAESAPVVEQLINKGWIVRVNPDYRDCRDQVTELYPMRTTNNRWFYDFNDLVQRDYDTKEPIWTNRNGKTVNGFLTIDQIKSKLLSSK